MLGFALVAFVAALASGITVVDENHVPVAGATVIFRDASGALDQERTAANGTAQPRPGFAARTARVAARGYIEADLDLRVSSQATLQHVLPVVGNVTVATGSNAALHRLPMATSVLDRSALAASPQNTTDAVLRALPGFDRTRSNSAFTNYGQLRASFLGAGNDRGVVLVDGFPAQDGFGGQIDWLAYPPGTIERSEVLLGSGSALYGSGGVGGVLDISTVAPRNDWHFQPDGRLGAGLGTNALSDGTLVARVPLGPSLTASLAAGTQRLAYRDLPPAYASPIDQPALASSGSTNAKIRYDIGETSLVGSFLTATDQQQEGRPNYSFARALEQFGTVATHAHGRFLERLAVYRRSVTVDNFADQYPTSPGVLRYDQHVPSNETGLALTLVDQGDRGDFVVRADQKYVAGVSRQTGSDGALQALGQGNQSIGGLALQQTLRSRRFEALLGIRGDSVRFSNGMTIVAGKDGAPQTVTNIPDRADAALSPRVAFRYDISPAFALRASSGEGFRAPFLNELLRGFQIGQTVYLANANLVPERSRTDTLGFDALGSTGHLSFDLSSTRVHDAIEFATIGQNLVKRENVARTQTDGATAIYVRRLSSCTRLRASGTTQYARITQGPVGVVDNRLQLVPNRSAYVGVDTSAGATAFSLGAAYVGQTYNDDLNQQPLGAALLVDGSATATLRSGTTVSLGVVNATHQTYLSSIDRFGPPLGVTLRVGLPLGSPAQSEVVCQTR